MGEISKPGWLIWFSRHTLCADSFLIFQTHPVCWFLLFPIPAVSFNLQDPFYPNLSYNFLHKHLDQFWFFQKALKLYRQIYQCLIVLDENYWCLLCVTTHCCEKTRMFQAAFLKISQQLIAVKFLYKLGSNNCQVSSIMVATWTT